MKKIVYSFMICGLCFAQKSLAQTPVVKFPISFPDGIIVGSSSTTIPMGSTYKLAVSGGILTEKVRVATNGTPFWADLSLNLLSNLNP